MPLSLIRRRAANDFLVALASMLQMFRAERRFRQAATTAGESNTLQSYGTFFAAVLDAGKRKDK
jgi:hypothetical protein